MEGKKWYLSKSVWAQAVTLLAQALAWGSMPDLQNYLAAHPEFAMSVATGIQALVAVVLRFVTKEPVKL